MTVPSASPASNTTEEGFPLAWYFTIPQPTLKDMRFGPVSNEMFVTLAEQAHASFIDRVDTRLGEFDDFVNSSIGAANEWLKARRRAKKYEPVTEELKMLTASAQALSSTPLEPIADETEVTTPTWRTRFGDVMKKVSNSLVAAHHAVCRALVYDVPPQLTPEQFDALDPASQALCKRHFAGMGLEPTTA